MTDCPDRATFTAMEHSTAEDWQVIASHFSSFAKALPDRVLAHLKLLDGDYGGFPIEPMVRRVVAAPKNSIYKFP